MLHIKIIVFWVAGIFRACADELPLATCKRVPERPTLQKRFKKLCLIMLMPLLKSTITKWYIFTPDFARRVVLILIIFKKNLIFLILKTNVNQGYRPL